MFVEVITTITSRIEIGDEGFEKIRHAVDVEGGDFGAALGERATMMIVESGLATALEGVRTGEWDQKTVITGRAADHED